MAERRQLRRGELLRAAIEVIRSEGANVTMEEMAIAGGISKPILYRHFDDRDGLVAAVTETALVEIGTILDAKLREVRIDAPPQSIRATIDAFFEYVEREPALYRFIVESDAKRGNEATMAFTERIAVADRRNIGAGTRRSSTGSDASGDLGAGHRRHGSEHGGVVARRRRHLSPRSRRRADRSGLGGDGRITDAC